jgi:hypothetical protein
VFGALDKLSRTLGRNVNPTVYSAAEFSKRAKNEKAFIARVVEGPKVWVIGSQDDLPAGFWHPSRDGRPRMRLS